MWQYLVVALILMGAVLFVFRRVSRSVKGRGCADCAGCGDCPCRSDCANSEAPDRPESPLSEAPGCSAD